MCYLFHFDLPTFTRLNKKNTCKNEKTPDQAQLWCIYVLKHNSYKLKSVS